MIRKKILTSGFIPCRAGKNNVQKLQKLARGYQPDLELHYESIWSNFFG